MTDKTMSSEGMSLTISENYPDTFDRKGFEECFDQSEIIVVSDYGYGSDDASEVLSQNQSIGLLGAAIAMTDLSACIIDLKNDEHQKNRDNFIRKKTYGRNRY